MPDVVLAVLTAGAANIAKNSLTALKTSTKLAKTIIKFEKFVGRTIKILNGKYQFLLKRVGSGIGIAGREVAKFAREMSDIDWLNFISKVIDNGKKIFLERYRKLMKACPSCTVVFDSLQLQKKFKHAKDFGIKVDYNPVNAKIFEQTLKNHVAKPNIKKINGLYRNQEMTFYFEPGTNLTVITYPNGEFLSGWKFYPNQAKNLLSGKNVT